MGALALGIAMVSVAADTVIGQTAKPAAAATEKKFKAPRTGDGQPDLQGVWANNNATPLQRPPQWAGKTVLTDRELAELKRVADEITDNNGDAQFGDGLVLAALEKISKPGSYDPATGNYNQFWIVDREFTDRRTSLINDPPDGKIPAMTPDAQTRMAAAAEYRKNHPADGPEDRPAGERCANFGVPKLGAGYNSYYQIFQTPTHVAILSEMAHDARIIPLDGRPHVGKKIQQWNGDARGRWEGDTLVVETTNFSPNSEFMGAKENLRLVEKFSRTEPERPAVRSDDHRPDYLDQALDGDDSAVEQGREHLRVRLPRRQRRHVRHSQRPPRRREGKGRCRTFDLGRFALGPRHLLTTATQMARVSD